MRSVGLVVVGLVLGIVLTFGWLATRSPHHVTSRSLPTEPWLRVTLSERYLTALARDAAAASELAPLVSDLRVDTTTHGIIVTCTFDALGQPLVLRARLQPVVRHDRLAVVVTRARVGRLPVPFAGAVEDVLNQRLAALLARTRLTATGVVVDDGGVTITARDMAARRAPATPVSLAN